jgi:ABC-type transporter Mla maintaining outer membrane lipid asymmetry ATPase subunit MlaF
MSYLTLESLAPTPVLEMIDVAVASVKNPDQVALEGIHWRVEAGDYWIIGGLHGSGKKDFIAAAAAILPPVRGAFRLFGREIGDQAGDELLPERLRLGLVFDGGQLLNHLTIEQNITLPIRYHRDIPAQAVEDRAQALLELTQLAFAAPLLPGELSRNWQQRAGLARALALQPEVLLLDNPLAGLDPRDAAWWVNLAAQLAAGHPIANGRPMTVVATGDDFRPWEKTARRFAVLKDRRLVPLEKKAGLTLHKEEWLEESPRT